MVIGIDHDTVCAGVVCAATAAQQEWGRPHECCATVAAQTTPAQTVWVVNFYSTMKTKQYTAKNAATMNRQVETSLADNAIVMITSIETASE